MRREFQNKAFIFLEKLVKKIENKAIDVDLVKKAFNLAYITYRGGLGTSNKLSILHSLEVANIVADFSMDTHSIVAIFLQDITVNYKDIKNYFGEEVANILKEITELNQIENESSLLNKKEQRITAYQDFLCKTSKNTKIWIIKFANSLHKMQRLNQVSDLVERKRIAEITMYIHAELAAKKGLQFFKEELQALAFAELYSEENKHIKTQVKELKGKNKNLVKEVVNDLKNTLLTCGLDYRKEISGREKKPFSIWQKIQNRKIPFNDMSDIFAFRIIVENVKQCYEVLHTIHNSYDVVDGSFKDYIDDPKKNRYQSLHIVVIVPEGYKVEVQIRTKEMHKIAEFGDAAHWRYKQG